MVQSATGQAQAGLQVMGVDPAMRRSWLAHNTGRALQAVGSMAFTADEARPNIENLVGAVHVALGVAGPIRVNGQYANGMYYVPFATTEGTLVSTYQYGMRAISEAGGANTNVAAERVCRHVVETGRCRRYYLRCNDSSDKKPSAINLVRTYGKEVVVDVTLPASVVETHLGVSPRDLLDFATAGRLGSMQAGTLGHNAHFAT